MKRDVILSRLLDKYEKSKHLSEPGVSKRRVMLRIEKNELPEYQYQEATVRDGFNQAVRELEREGLIFTQWLSGRPVLSAVVLNLECVAQCYQAAGRVHPGEQAEIVSRMVQDALAHATVSWIIGWRDDICTNAESTYAVPSYCRRDTLLLSKLLMALVQYDSLHGEPVTMRAFSSKCYHNSKTFEREVRETFLRIAERYYTELAEVCEHEELGVRDKLAYLGIYARPEHYEISGNCVVITKTGMVNIAAAYPYGIALPSTTADLITEINLRSIRKIIFIENKTNYDEYLISELAPDTLAVYHGGFLSPQKRKLFSKIQSAIPSDAQAFFWADIDLGGFQMFSRLREIIPDLQPIRMTGEDVVAHSHNGLKRSEEYLRRLDQVLSEKKYPMFEDAIREILNYGITIEQETFLT